MKTMQLSILMLFLILIFFPLSAFAQDYTQWGLPEGATVRLGKGGLRGNIVFSPDSTLLAVSTAIGIWIYDGHTGKELKLLTTRTGSISSIAFSPDGKTLASSSSNEFYLWDVATGEHKATFTGHTADITSVAFSPDGKVLATGGDEKEGLVKFWDVDTGTLEMTLTGHTDSILSVAFSPDGKTLASGGMDRDVHLWDVAAGEHKIALIGHTDRITSVAFSPDGKTLASSGDWRDRTVRLWDPISGEHKSTFIGYASGSESIAFSPDGTTLAVAGFGGVILLWKLGTTAELPLPLLEADVNGDGVEDIQDLVLVAANFGQTGPNAADVNGDGVVDAADLIKVAAALDNAAAAPSAAMLNVKNVRQWLTQARQLDLTDTTFQRGIHFLEQLLETLAPTETVLLPNYPNPFNPETWIPYQLVKAAHVTLRIHSADGKLVRTLALGHQCVGIYHNRSRAAHWDGNNEFGEPVASGVYFYTLTAENFSATRKMLIRK